MQHHASCFSSPRPSLCVLLDVSAPFERKDNTCSSSVFPFVFSLRRAEPNSTRRLYHCRIQPLSNPTKNGRFGSSSCTGWNSDFCSRRRRGGLSARSGRRAGCCRCRYPLVRIVRWSPFAAWCAGAWCGRSCPGRWEVVGATWKLNMRRGWST
jgi:hypothetical protein